MDWLTIVLIVVCVIIGILILLRFLNRDDDEGGFIGRIKSAIDKCCGGIKEGLRGLFD